MIAFIYDALYLLPLTLIPALWSAPDFFPDAPIFWVGMLSTLTAIMGLMLLHLRSAWKVLPGVLFASAFIIPLLLLPEEIRTRILSEHSWIFLVLLLSAASFALGRLLLAARITRGILAAGGTIALIVVMLLHIRPPQTAVAFLLFFVLCTLADEIQLRWKKSGTTDHRSHLVFLSPFLLLILLYLLLVPVPDRPYDWRLVQTLWKNAEEGLARLEWFFTDTFHKESDDHFMGFSDLAQLSSDIQGNDRQVMELSFRTTPPAVIYLTGKSFDTFDGREWTKTYRDSTDDARMDTLELVYSLLQYPSLSFTDYCRSSVLDIRFLQMHTTHAFAPSKYCNILIGNAFADIQSEGGDLFFTEDKNFDDSYRIQYYSMNLSHPLFGEFLNSPHPDSPAIWEEACSRLPAAAASYEELLAYRERMNNIYSTPVSLSPALSEYMDTLLEGADNALAKAVRIEALLSSMTYDRAPGELPEEIDTTEEFLDHLVFENQRGYCVYYATAFVLLARSQGIPARFVQGYRVETAGNAVVPVTENHAHAWAECYFAGVGWIPFEPTPGLKSTVSWKSADEIHAMNIEHPASELTLSPQDTEESGKEKSAAPKYILLSVILSLAVLLLLIPLNLLLQSQRFRKADNEGKYRFLFQRNMTLLRFLGYKRMAEETLEEFRKRGEKELAAALFTFLTDYERYLYGSAMISAGEVTAIQTNNQALLDCLKNTKRRGKWLRLLYYHLFPSYSAQHLNNR